MHRLLPAPAAALAAAALTVGGIAGGDSPVFAAGNLGRLYGAKTTPDMFVIDKNGVLQYMGSIDSIATADAADIPNAEPYLKEAMLAVAQGRPVAHAVTRAYGCSVKY